MKKPPSDPSIRKEPHLQRDGFSKDMSERKADRVLDKSRESNHSKEMKVERTVWDEPALSAELVGERPSGELIYSTWLTDRRGEISFVKSTAITMGIALVAGPIAIIGAFYGSGRTVFSILAIVVFGPVIEEVMKVAMALFVVEKRPFYFRSSFQIILCVLAGSFVFSAIENLVYHHWYVPNPPAKLVQWRWTVCVALHMICSLIAGLGLVRIWKRTWKNLERPQMTLAYPFVLAAAILHGIYNGFVVVLQYIGFHF